MSTGEFDWKRAILGDNDFFWGINYLGLVASIVLIYIAGHAVQSTWSYYTMEKYSWDEDMVGYSLAFVGLMVAFVQGWLIRFIIPKLGQERSVYVGLTLYAIGFLLFGIAHKDDDVPFLGSLLSGGHCRSFASGNYVRTSTAQSARRIAGSTYEPH